MSRVENAHEQKYLSYLEFLPKALSESYLLPLPPQVKGHGSGMDLTHRQMCVYVRLQDQDPDLNGFDDSLPSPVCNDIPHSQ